MSVTDEATSVAMGMTKEAFVEISKKFMEASKELLKILLLQAINRAKKDKAKPGMHNTIKHLLSHGNLSAPIMIDKDDVQHAHRLAKEYQIPIAILKGQQGHRMFFRESDLGKVSEMMKELLKQKLDRENLKQIVLDKVDASYFKNRAKQMDLPVTYLKNGDKIKVSFPEAEIEKVKLIVHDMEEDKKKVPLRQIRFDRLKDSFSRTPVLRIYDRDLNKSLKLKLPITKSGFIRAVRSHFGYTYKEAQDLASRVRSGAEKNMLITGLKGEFQWKPDMKSLSENIEKLERNIKISSDPDTIEGYSFSQVQLADEKQSKMLTIMDKRSGESVSTLQTTRDDLISQVKSRFAIDDKLANQLAEKASKLGFINDPSPVHVQNQNSKTKKPNIVSFFDIQKSNNAKTATVSLNGISCKVLLENMDKSIESLQGSFGITKRQATSLFNRVVKHNAKDAMLSAQLKSNVAPSTSSPALTMTAAKVTKGAR